mmetsp:Transcript_5468/g.13380  ORF Transcript_5468/g.13380 Transcript_5468/m.13380 type:complete len:806 (-) Transcript_5468:94-2511(-)
MAPCCCPRGAKRLIDEDQDGPRTYDERHCTDTLCLLVFTLAMVFFAFLGAVSFEMSDVRSLSFARDHLGRRCGVGELSKLPKVHYPRLASDLLTQSELIRQPWRLQLFGICTATCPQRGDPPIRDAYGESVEWPVAVDTVDVLNRCVPIAEESASSTVACAFPRCEEVPLVDVQCLTVPGHESEGLWAMRSPLQRIYCQRQLTILKHERYEVPSTGPLITSVAHAVGTLSAAAGNIMKAQSEVIVCGVGLALFLGSLWLVFLRFFARCTVWLLLACMALVQLFATLFCAFKANLLGDRAGDLQQQADSLLAASGFEESSASLFDQLHSSEEQSERSAFVWATCFLVVVSVLFVLLLGVLRRSIDTVIGIITQATRAFGAQPTLLVIPFASIAVILVLLGYGLVMLCLLASSTPTPDALATSTSRVEARLSAAIHHSTLRVVHSISSLTYPHEEEDEPADAAYEPTPSSASAALGHLVAGVDPEVMRAILCTYHLFGLLWLLSFVQAISWTAMSGAVSHWFFFRNDPTERTCAPVLCSLYRTLRFHLGSLAMGALCVAIVQLVRFVFELIVAQAKRFQEGSSLANVVIRCTRCCLWCLETCVRYVSAYAYIFVALSGDSFCVACKDTYRLVLDYPAQAFLIQLVQSLLFAVQSVLLPVACALTCYWMVATQSLVTFMTWIHPFARDASSHLDRVAQYVVDRSASLGIKFEYVGLPTEWLNEPFVAGTSVDTDPVWPAVAAFVLAFMVARNFGLVYECVVDTIYVCAMQDKEEYGAENMPEELRRCLGLEDQPEQDTEPEIARGRIK